MTNPTLSSAELKNLFRRIEQLETRYETLTSVTNRLVQSQSVFEYKHEQASAVSSKLENLVGKISEKGEEQLQHTIRMLDEREQNISRQIDHYRELLELDINRRQDNATAAIQAVNTSVSELKISVEGYKTSNDLKVADHGEKIDNLTKIIWVATGIAVAIGTFIQYAIDIIK